MRSARAAAPAVLGAILVACASPVWADAPIGQRVDVLKAPYLLGSWTQMEQIYPSRMIARGGPVRVLPPATRALGDVRYAIDGETHDLDSYLARNAVMGLLVLKDGRIAYETYRKGTGETTRFVSWSVAKSMTSTLVGVALEDGAITSLAHEARRYVPELAASGYGGASLRDILQMTSGVRFVEDYASIDSLEGQAWLAGVVEQRLPFNETTLWFDEHLHHPGTHFYYASMEPQVSAWVVRRTMGRPLAEIVSERIWSKIGAEHDASWMLDRPGGMEIGGCCINATLRDFGRFGQLFLDEGRVGNEQVLPAAWVRAATRPDPERSFLHPGAITGAGFAGSLGLGYQYNWWLWPEDGAYSAIGFGGQWIYVNPAARIVIVQSAIWTPASAGKGYRESQALFRSIVDALR